MTQNQKDQAIALRSQGYGYATIANAVGVKKDKVVALCRKHGLTGTKAKAGQRVQKDASVCQNCGTHLAQLPKRKPRKFCSDHCRLTWWAAHRKELKPRRVYSFICANCGEPFTTQGNANRKYCSHACYVTARFKGGESHA